MNAISETPGSLLEEMPTSTDRPGQIAGTGELGGMRRCEHSDEPPQGQDGWGGGWVRALAVATFDVGTGHTLEQVRPRLHNIYPRKGRCEPGQLWRLRGKGLPSAHAHSSDNLWPITLKQTPRCLTRLLIEGQLRVHDYLLRVFCQIDVLLERFRNGVR